MADISKITLPTGTTYNIKDATARSYLYGANLWYGTNNALQETPNKVVETTMGEFRGDPGCVVVVKFANANTAQNPTLTVDDVGPNPITTNPYITGTGYTYLWAPGAVCMFVYDGTNFILVDNGSRATTSTFGSTMLVTSTTSTSTDTAATPKSVSDALTAAKSYTDTAIVGNATFQGVINANTAISNLSNYKKGWYWVVGTAGAYVGQTCEVGDFVFCVSDRASAYSATDFKVVQANIDMNIFGELAFSDSVSASYTPAGTVSQPTFTGTAATISVSGTIANSVTLASQASQATGAADVTPAGTVSQPTFSGTTKYVKPSTATVNSITEVGTLPSCTLPVFETSVLNENLTIGWTDGSFSAGTLPKKGNNTTVVTGISAATSSSSGAVDVTPAGTVSQPTFSGTTKYVKATVGTASKTMTGSYTPAGTVSQPTFTGTAASIVST